MRRIALLSSLLFCAVLAHGEVPGARDAHVSAATTAAPAQADPLASLVGFLRDLGVATVSAVVTYGLLLPLYRRRPRR